MFNSTKAKRDSQGVWWCAQPTTIEVSMERVFGVTVHSHKKWKEGFALGNSSYLKIQGFEGNLSHHLLFFVVVDFF